ncbi:MAG: tRNA (adenosine(37)-N6)-dimethylallyltransferase MiaA, partial [Bacteroidales bacterium]|nr:tRNA (adenosine(37)-N6)-dimethylallyltransferase MiaA [Bacteroidales bacterium]
MKNTLVVICGPTAVGKTSLAIDLAKHLTTEIISADSRQFYKELKIGVAAPTAEERQAVPHHFVGHLSVKDYYNVSRFEQDVLAFLEKWFQKNPVALMVGGSGLYIDAVCKGIDDFPDPPEELRSSLQTKRQKEGISALRQELKVVDPEYYKLVDLDNPNRILRALEVFHTTGIPFSELRKNTKKERPF